MKLHKSVLTLSILALAGYGPSAVGLDITLENKPVNYSNRAKPNVLLAIDDSGSMDVELSVKGTVEGYAYWKDESFVVGGEARPDGGTRYMQLFPLGYRNATKTNSSTIYNGGRLWGGRYIPPFDAYGFFRNSDWNPAYYDPKVTYAPWPSYGGHAWPNIDKTVAWLDPALTGSDSSSSDRYLDLTATTLSTKFSGDDGKFDFRTGMWCDNSGTKCTADEAKGVDYWAATYYVKDKTSSFTVTSGSSSTATYVDPSNAKIIEAESGALSSVIVKYDTSAGGEGYVDFSATSDDFFTSPPATYEAAWTFETATTPTTAEIWVRHRMASDANDSFWLAMDDYDSSQIAEVDTNTWVTLDSEDWYGWRDGHDSVTSTFAFRWEKWADVTLDDSGSHTLRIRQREKNSGLDQIAIVLGTTPTFGSSPLTNDSSTTSKTYSCGTAADLLPVNYAIFHESPSSIDGVDALAPDGSCLKKVEIKSGTTSYDSGRTYEQEIQNFANWFTYYRKRHQVARGALGSALQGIGGIRAGLYWINNRPELSMYDLDSASDVTAVLKQNYYYINDGSTPNRSALKHAGEQLDTNKKIIEYACQKNYTLLFTDGYDNDRGEWDPVKEEWTEFKFPDSDGGAGTPYADTIANTLADVAYYYYATRLRTDLDEDKVPVPESCTDGTAEPWVDCQTNLHMNTYTVSMGLTGEEVFEQSYTHDGKSKTYTKVKDAYNVSPSWPSSLGFDGRMMDDLYHAAVNGRGEMFNAKKAKDLSDELQDAINTILATEGSASGLSFNTATLSTESLLFSASFNTTKWSGELKATNLDSVTGLPDGVAWSVQEKLDAQSSRSIITYNPATQAGVPFQWDNLTATQQADLKTAPDGTTESDEVNAKLRLDFLRGDRSEEGGLFRERASRLGDIVNSSPVYVGPAVMGWPEYKDNDLFGSDTHSYSRFKVEVADTRKPIVYVAANDGMIHGFLADRSDSAGEERLAYVPSAVYSTEKTRGLHYLTNPDYSHRFYTDGEPIYSDVFIKSKGEAVKKWRTLLAGGHQGGAKGLYVLDVTDPSTFTEANADKRVLFEFTGNMDDDLGYLHEPPLIGMMNTGEWALIFGNGFNSVNGNGVVYIVMIESVTHNGWLESGVDQNVYKFDTQKSGAVSGISGADTNGDRVIDYIYAADAAGHVWSLDVRDETSPGSWDFAYKSGSTPAPLFTATNDAGEAQPINVRPRAIKNIYGSGGSIDPNRLIIFGTGQMLQNGDLDNVDEQSFYAVWDRGNGNLTRSSLAKSTLTQDPVTMNRTLDNGTTLYSGSNKGFYVDFDTVTGERIIDYIDIRQHGSGDHYALFSSVVPDKDACSYGGRSWINAFDLGTGTTPEAVFDTNGDGVVNGDDDPLASIPNDHFLVDFVSSGQNGYGNSSEGKIITTTLEGGMQLTNGRLGWQELINR